MIRLYLQKTNDIYRVYGEIIISHQLLKLLMLIASVFIHDIT